jgi:hypothetical protein
LGQQAVTAMPDPVGFHGHIPAALRFVEATEQQIHLLVQHPFGMVAFPTAARALAAWYIKRGHIPSSGLSGANRTHCTPVIRTLIARDAQIGKLFFNEP